MSSKAGHDLLFKFDRFLIINILSRTKCFDYIDITLSNVYNNAHNKPFHVAIHVTFYKLLNQCKFIQSHCDSNFSSLQEVLIELSKVGKLCSVSVVGEVALDLTLSANKLPQNQSKDKSQSQRQSQ